MIHPLENAYARDGGLAILFGNLAEEGAVVKKAGRYILRVAAYNSSYFKIRRYEKRFPSQLNKPLSLPKA